MAACASGCSAIPLLRDRGPLDRLAARAGGAEAGGARCGRAGSWSGWPPRSGRARADDARAPARVARPQARPRRPPGGAHRPALHRPQGGAGDRARRRADAAARGWRQLAAAACRSPRCCGWFGPDVWLSREGRLRQERIERDLPDFMDILAVTVRAGLGYRRGAAARLRVARRAGGRGDADVAAPDGARRDAAARRSWPCATRNSSESLKSIRRPRSCRPRSSACRCRRRSTTSPRTCAAPPTRPRAAGPRARRRASRLIVTTLIVPGTMILILPRSSSPPDIRESGLLSGEPSAVRHRGPDGAGGWLESACKLIISVRIGILLVTLLVAAATRTTRTPAIVAILAAGDRVVRAAALLGPRRPGARAPPGLLRGRAGADDGDPAAHRRREPVLLLHARHRAARRAALRRARRGAVLPLLVGVYFWVLDARADVDALPDTFQTLVGQPALYLVAAAAGAATRRLLDRQAEAEARAGRAGAPRWRPRPSARGWRATCTTRWPRRCRASASRALALSRRIERDPEGAAAEARRLADDARQATREAREIIVGAARATRGESLPLLGVARGEARGAGRRRPGSRSTSRSRTSASCTRRRRASSSGSCARRWRNAARHARATRVAVRLRRLGGRAVLTIADDGARLRGARRPRGRSPRGRHFGVGRHARARAAGRRRPQRRVRARRGLRAVGLGPGRPRRAATAGLGARARRAAAAPPAPPTVRYRPARRPRVHMAVIRVLLVDDNAIVRRGIASLLGRGRRDRGGRRGRRRPRGDRRRARDRAPTSSAWTSACRSWTASPPPGR